MAEYLSPISSHGTFFFFIFIFIYFLLFIFTKEKKIPELIILVAEEIFEQCCILVTVTVCIVDSSLNAQKLFPL